MTMIMLIITKMRMMMLNMTIKMILQMIIDHQLVMNSSGSSLFVFYILVAAFLMDQKHKLSGVAQRPLPGLPSISSVVSLERF